jgi:ubiquinone/menaquinone biosynthesis C-methylase UbiE
MGFLMSHMNNRQNYATVRALEIPDGAAILEIGFGPGRALAQIAAETKATHIDGIDHSHLMVETAARRNRASFNSGRMTVAQGDVESLTAANNTYDICFAVNNFQQWPDQARSVAEIMRVLKPGGQVCLSIRVPKRDTSIETVRHTRKTVACAYELLQSLGFEAVQITEHDLGKRLAVLVTGTNPR